MGVRQPPRAADAPLAGKSPARGKLREIDALVAIALLLCVVLAYVSRFALNPDGVSYLDLAAALRRGDLAHFVQGYWSPLYPVILAVAGAVSGVDGRTLVPVVHLVNLIIAGAGILIVWAHVRRRDDAALGRLTLAAFLLCGARPPRIDAVTPDLLLQVALLGATYELLREGGFRWLRLGVLLGVAFLTKTSAWPWLLVVFAVLLWNARRERAFRSVGLAGAACSPSR